MVAVGFTVTVAVLQAVRTGIKLRLASTLANCAVVVAVTIAGVGYHPRGESLAAALCALDGGLTYGFCRVAGSVGGVARCNRRFSSDASRITYSAVTAHSNGSFKAAGWVARRVPSPTSGMQVSARLAVMYLYRISTMFHLARRGWFGLDCTPFSLLCSTVCSRTNR